MGVEYSARIIVGLPHEELEEFLEGVDDPYDLGLYVCSPYYDAEYEECLFGVIVQRCEDFSYSRIDEKSWVEKVAEAHKKFTEKTGKEGTLYLSTYGS